MHKTHAKRRRDIKNKLMAAICMLLVSSIMMVSTTYAWFTLSTAPEVTGINTAVGANGNLEMALLPASGQLSDISSAAGDSVKSANLRNVTWGNLVDVSDNTFYGMNNLKLYPAALNVATWDNENTKLNPTSIAEAMLETPSYGADGRVAELLKNTVTSTYDSTTTNFPQNTEFGVRAVGTASGMTDRQLDYRNYRSAASTAMSQAKVFASQSLNTNGASLANIAMAHAVDANATHDSEDVNSLLAIINDLLGDADTTGVLQYVEKAYINYIIAMGASQASVEKMDDTAFSAFVNTINGTTDSNSNGTNLDEVKEQLSSKGISLGTTLDDAIDALVATRATVTAAKGELEDLPESGITWAQISVPLNKLANTSAMEVNKIKVSEVKEKMSDLVSSVTAGGGLTVTISTGGGVYADVADHCGNFNASITIAEVSYGGVTLNDMPARMETNTTVDDTAPNMVYLDQLAAAVTTAGAPTGQGGQIMPISDFYGYIIDLAFRTNAAESNLLLQQEAADRIYKGSNGAEITSTVDGVEKTESTMGHGATMTFTATEASFTTDQMKDLMKAIRIVFFNPDNRAVVATGKLDLANATVTGGTTVTATIYLYTVTSGGGYVAATYDAAAAEAGTKYYTLTTTYETVADPATATEQLYLKDGETYEPASYTEGDTTNTYYKRVDTYSEYTAGTAPAEGTQLYVVQAAGEVRKTDNVIMPLNQNQATKLSVLVYLDGENVGNDDVAYSGSTSMTGTMNLQFASSANLVPMEYTPLMNQGAEETTETSGAAGGGENAGG